MKAEFTYQEAKAIAEQVVEILKPHCYRVEIAGSIRREKSVIGDIEIVAIPKPYQDGLFENGLAYVVNTWQKVKGEMVYGKVKYTQRILPEGIKLDLFFAIEKNFGNIMLIRTGDWEFSKHFMGIALPLRGYRSEDGVIWKGHNVISVPTEETLFELAGISYIEPKERSLETIKRLIKKE